MLLVIPLALPALSRTALAGRETGEIREEQRSTRHEAHHYRGSNNAVIGIVEKMSGPCFVVRGGRGGKVSISIGLRVFENNRLVTDPMSRLHVRYKDGTYAELGSDTSFEIERLRFKPPNPLPSNKAGDQFDESIFRFNHGLMRVTAPEVHVLERFMIKTTHGLIRVTGPADFYLIQLEGDRDLVIRVAKGKVELISTYTNEVMPVPQGTGATLKLTGVITKAGTFTEEQLKFLKSRTRI